MQEISTLNILTHLSHLNAGNFALISALGYFNRTYSSEVVITKITLCVMTNTTFVTIFVLDCKGRVDLYVNRYYNKRLNILNTRKVGWGKAPIRGDTPTPPIYIATAQIATKAFLYISVHPHSG